MKNRPCLAFLFTLLLLCLTNVQAAQPGQTEVSDGQTVFDADGESEFNTLSSKAAEAGAVQVMVVLKEGGVLSKAKGKPESEEKTIEAMQKAVLKDMPKRKRVVKRFKQLPVLALSADVAELKQLRSSPYVAEIVEDNINLPLALTPTVNKVGGNASWALGYTGAGQTIAILDNGILNNHPYFTGKVVREACYSTKNKSQKVTPSCRGKKTKDVKPGAATVNCNFQDFSCTHGTLLAGLAAGNSGAADFIGSGAAPHANLIVLKVNSFIKNKKVCGSNTPCSVFFDSDLLRGLEFVYSQRSSLNIAAVNVSIGGSSSPKQCKRSPIKRTIAKLKAVGIATLAASGNDGSNKKLSTPACVAGVIAVGTSTDSDTVAAFTNSSSQLALLAPGVNIGMTMPGVVNPGFEVVASGTSLSAALATGAWATLKGHNPNATVDQILAALTSTGVPLADPKNGVVKPRIQLNSAHAVLP
jgi:subtilisin